MIERVVPEAGQPAGRPGPAGVQVGASRRTRPGRRPPGAGDRCRAAGGADGGQGDRARRAGRRRSTSGRRCRSSGRRSRAMVEVQLLTGMRPGEVCQLRPCDIDTAGPVWVFRPRQHKTRHRGEAAGGRDRPEGPGGARRSSPRPTRRTTTSARGGRSRSSTPSGPRARKTPRYASHMAGTRRSGRRARSGAPAERYTVTSYGRAVRRASSGRTRGGSGWPGRATSTRSRTGTRTNSGTPTGPRSAGGSGWRPPRSRSATSGPTSPRSTPSETRHWPRGSPRRWAEPGCWISSLAGPPWPFGSTADTSELSGRPGHWREGGGGSACPVNEYAPLTATEPPA